MPEARLLGAGGKGILGLILFRPHLDHDPAEQSGDYAADDEADRESAHAAFGAIEPVAEAGAGERQHKRKQATGSEQDRPYNSSSLNMAWTGSGCDTRPR
jgi:hypothetical protein